MCSETGEQLLARLASKPDLTALEPTLFPDGPTPQTVTELCGEEGCGKTQFLLHLLASAILPQSWHGTDIGGLETGVVWIDTECQLSLVRLMGILESRVRQQTSTSITEEHMDALMRDSLKRVHIVRCHSSTNLLLTLHSVESLLSAQSNIGLLLIDSMSAFYWVDRCNVAESNALQEAAFKKITAAIEHLVRSYKLAAFATTTALFQKRVKKPQNGEDFATAVPSGVRESHEYSDYLGRSWQRLVTRRMVFSKDSNRQGAVFAVSVETQGSTVKLVKQFTLGDSGVVFL